MRTTTYQRILDEALTLFAERGFDGTSLQQVADAVGLTKAALYYHFRSKDDLLEALVTPVFDDLDRRLAAGATPHGSATTTDGRVEDYLDFLLAQRAVIGFLTRDLGVLSHPAVASRVRHAQRGTDELLLGGGLNPAERVLATMVLSGMQGAVAAHGASDPALVRDIVLATVRTILDATPARSGIAS